VFRLLTDKGTSGYKKFSMSLCNSQGLAQYRFDRANDRTAALTDASRQAETSSIAFSVPGSSKTKSAPDSSSHWTLSERPSPKGLLTGNPIF
jgi:hypothetical protein